MCEVVQNQVVSKWDQAMANGTHHFEHIPSKSIFLGGEAWLFLFLVPGMKLEHRLNALASNVLN